MANVSIYLYISSMRKNHIPYDKALYMTPIYRAWSNMKTRCTNESLKDFYRYGGRHIAYCERWQYFANFYEDMGPTYFDGATIDRINNDGNYCKENCRWTTKKVQANNRRSSRRIEYNGEVKTMAEWIEYFGLKSSTVRQRYYVLKLPLDKVFQKK